jgi:hypothetical protein
MIFPAVRNTHANSTRRYQPQMAQCDKKAFACNRKFSTICSFTLAFACSYVKLISLWSLDHLYYGKNCAKLVGFKEKKQYFAFLKPQLRAIFTTVYTPLMPGND